MIRLALHGDQILRLDLEEVFDQTLFANQWNRVGEKGFEEFKEFFRTFDVAEVLEWHEQCDGPSAVLVGEGDHHELSARPNVEIVVRHFELKEAL